MIRGDECELSGANSRKRRGTDSTLGAANLNVLAAVLAARQTATFGCGRNAAFSELRLPSAVHPQKEKHGRSPLSQERHKAGRFMTLEGSVDLQGAASSPSGRKSFHWPIIVPLR